MQGSDLGWNTNLFNNRYVGMLLQDAALSGFTMQMSGGNIEWAEIRLYGMVKS